MRPTDAMCVEGLRVLRENWNTDDGKQLVAMVFRAMWEVGNPAGAGRTGVGAPVKYPFATMKVGEVFVVPLDDDGRYRTKLMSLQVYASRMQTRYPGRKFSCKELNDGTRTITRTA